jgi:hypothetical protein
MNKVIKPKFDTPIETNLLLIETLRRIILILRSMIEIFRSKDILYNGMAWSHSEMASS